MSIRQKNWRCREVHWEGEPIPETTFTLKSSRNIDAQKAAEMAAQHLDAQEHGDDFTEWNLGHVMNWKTLEVEQASGVWERFRVQLRVHVDYVAFAQPAKTEGK